MCLNFLYYVFSLFFWAAAKAETLLSPAAADVVVCCLLTTTNRSAKAGGAGRAGLRCCERTLYHSPAEAGCRSAFWPISPHPPPPPAPTVTLGEDEPVLMTERTLWDPVPSSAFAEPKRTRSDGSFEHYAHDPTPPSFHTLTQRASTEGSHAQPTKP